jgi:cellulose synthase/poly-beta-1,6-N-acetylglucosamine synthase-like glycosyltransferase
VSEQDLPFCSIIVPTFNRRRQLQTCLQALAGQDYPRDRFEVLVVDDGSVHHSASSMPTGMIDLTQHGFRLARLRRANGGRAGQVSSAFTDGGARDSRWLRSADALSQWPDCMVGSRR